MMSYRVIFKGESGFRDKNPPESHKRR